MSDHLDPLRDALRGQRTGSWVGAAVFEAFAIGMVLPFSEKFRQAINLAPLGGGAWVLGIFGAGLALTAAYFARKALVLRDLERAPLLAKLLHDPEDVVWVHAGIRVDYRVYGSTTNQTQFVSVLCSSRENASIEVPIRRVRAVLSGLEDHLPHATIGDFSPELLAKYQAEPDALRRKPRSSESSYRETAKAKPPVKLPSPPSAPYLAVAAVCCALGALGPWLYELVG